MQHEVKNLISDLTGQIGITGPIPYLMDERKKKEQEDEVSQPGHADDKSISATRRKSS